MGYHLDEIDQRIVHALMSDARNTSAPMIAEDMNVSAATIRNRIERLEEADVIQGYTATVDFERAGGRLTSLYMCTVPAADRERLALAAQSIPGVINVRILMAGRRDLHVVAVGEDTEDLRDIARSISELDIQIEDEELVQTEIRSPYEPFDLDSKPQPSDLTDVVTLSDGTDVVEVVISESSHVEGQTYDEVRETELLGEDAVVISVERDGQIFRPTGDTTFKPDDVVTLLPPKSSKQDVLQSFLSSSEDDPE